MAHGVSEVLGCEGSSVKMVHQKQQQQPVQNARKSVGVMGSRRIFAPAFKLKVLDSYRNDIDCRGNQRATARKYGIHRRQIQKWLQCEDNLRNSCGEAVQASSTSASKDTPTEVAPAAPALNLSLARLHGDELANQQPPPPLPSASNSGILPSVGYQEYQEHQAQEVRYETHYVSNGEVQERKVYQTLTTYTSHPRDRYQEYLEPDGGSPSYGLLLAPSMIKTERASPDSAATPGPYEQTPSPGAQFPAEPSSPVRDTENHVESRSVEEVQEEVKEEENPESLSPSPCEYSLPSSPRGPGSSGRSSCSDSEDPLDCSSSSQGSDLSRRRSFPLRFKLDVLDAFHRDVGVAGNQRATARKFGINRRQVQKWLGQETELRGEILRGTSRQRLGGVQEESPSESPIDLRTTYPQETCQEPYCCDLASRNLYYPTPEPEAETGTCSFPCCYPDPQTRLYCYSPRDYPETEPERTSSPLKRPHCTLSCCYEASSPKRYCPDTCQTPPQETPLCLVKPKGESSPEVTSTVPTPPASRKDAILFKPYLDNPVSKPKERLSPVTSQNLLNNNNCQGACNLNEGHDYALELSLRLPVSWRTHPYEFQQVRSAFVRYPASPHYT